MMKEDREDPGGKIRELLEAGELGAFDVRAYELNDIFAVEKENFERDLEHLRMPVRKRNDILVKTAIGKKWADTFGCDDDASEFIHAILQKTMIPDGEIGPSHGYGYVIVKDGTRYRSDTMNSWTAVLEAFLLRRADTYLKESALYGQAKNKNWIPPKYSEWHVVLSDPDNYKGVPFPSYITHFMEVVHTIGNFIPAPFAFRNRESAFLHSKGYWDLALMCIYGHYQKRGGDGRILEETAPKYDLEWLLDRRGTSDAEECERWLDQFETWEGFVEQNFMQPFLEDEDDLSSPPKELWEGHFTGVAEPKEDKHFKEFFENAAERIQKRGVRIAKEYEKNTGTHSKEVP